MSVDPSQLVLRRPVDYDAEEILGLASDPAVLTWNPIRDVRDIGTARKWCRDSADWGGDDHATWVAIDAASGGLAATCALFDISTRWQTAGIGYRVAPWARGSGVARACVYAVALWGFAEYALERIQLAHSVGNQASCRVAIASGFAVEGTLRSSYVDLAGTRHDEHIHGRLVSDPAPALGKVPRLEP